MTPSHLDDNARTVSDVMITTPKTHQRDATIEIIRGALEDLHVHMILLTHNGVLHGTVVRDDIPAAAPDSCPALELANLRDRTIAPTENLDAIWQRLETSDQRRIAVVDDANTLLGLVCLKRDRTGFCADDDVRSRTIERRVQRTRSSRCKDVDVPAGWPARICSKHAERN